MNIRISPSTKFMAVGIALSLGWFILESCDCDETKQDKFSGSWVVCDGQTPKLMRYSDNQVVPAYSSNFDPSKWNCSHTDSPPLPKKGTPALHTGTQTGPVTGTKPRDTTSGTAYLPQQLRVLPFLPPVPPSQPGCDSSYPDVFQTDHPLALVTRISTCPLKIVTTIPVVSRPLQIEITPDGSTALVTSFDNAVNFIDVATNKVTFTLKTDQSINPQGVAISPDGTRAYVTSFNTVNAVVLVIDLASRSVIATIPTIQYPQGVRLTPDGSQIWITSPLAPTVDIFDTLTNTRVTGLPISQSGDVAFNLTGTRAYVTSQSSVPGIVAEVDTSTYQILKTYTVDAGPTEIGLHPGGTFLVVNNESGSISVIDLTQDSVITTKTQASPSGISFVH